MTTEELPRLESLDVFRGVTIAAMILVSTPGTWEAVYRPLDHAAWNGWTPTDLVFPFLLFAMGAAVPLAMRRRRSAPGQSRIHVWRRAALLFAFGLALNAVHASGPLSWSTFRFPGVLQRIALVYLPVAWLTDRTSTRTQVAVAVSALLGYWGIMTLVPVPGIGAGVLSETGNLASHIDRWVLGGHMGHATWDSEGLLSTIPAVATALAGVFAGDWMNRRGSGSGTLALWAAGVALMVTGLLWGRVFPINKNLWTSSFALFTAGLAVQALAIFHWVLDIHHARWWAVPFLAFGRNPLAGYFLSVGTDSLLTKWPVAGSDSLKGAIFHVTFARWIGPCCGTEAASLAYALAYVAVWAAVLGLMYRRRIFIGI